MNRKLGSADTDPHRYDDMLDLPHHQSRKHKHMSMHDRAAQFAPFAALTGFDRVIDQTAKDAAQKIIDEDSFTDEPPSYL